MDTLISQKKSDDAAEAMDALETSAKILARMIVKEVMAELKSQERFFGDLVSGLAASRPSDAIGDNQSGKRLVLSVADAAKLLGVSKGNTYNLIKMGQIPCIKWGKRILIQRYALMKLLEEAGSVKPGSA